MSFTVSSFKSLIEKYPTWESLSAFLTSEEGGSLRICTDFQHESYVVIRYVKGKSDFSKPWVRDARSIVWDTRLNRAVCMAPVKSESTSEVPEGTNVRVSEFVDGSMINAFRPASGPTLLTTRSVVNSNMYFYDHYSVLPVSYPKMFDEALPAWQEMLDSILQPYEFVSFVIQHPHNRIVTPIKKARIFVTYTGKANADGTFTMHSDPLAWNEKLRKYAPKTYTQPFSLPALAKENGYSWQGLVLQDTTSSRRWKLRNKFYSFVKTLRGTESSGFLIFLRLRKNGELKNYLKYYPEESNLFWRFEQLLRETTNTLFTCYVNKNKLKTHTMKDFPIQLRPHVYALHGLYINSLPPKPTPENPNPPLTQPITINREFVIDYVNKLPVEGQRSLIRYTLQEPKYKLDYVEPKK